MLELESTRHSLIENFDLMKGMLSALGPESFQILREKAFRQYSEFGIPNAKDEEFKYFPARALEEGKFGPAYGAILDRNQLEATALGGIDAITVGFINGEFAPELSSEQVLPDGVFIGSIADGLAEYEEIIVRYLGEIATLKGKLGSTNDERFTYLNTAFLADGAFVYLPKGVSLERAIHLVFVSSADYDPFATHPRTLIVIEENSDAKLLESYIGLTGSYFTNPVTEVMLGPTAILEHTRYQIETGTAVHVGSTYVHQAEDSIYSSNSIAFGSRISRHELNVWLDGEHTETWLNGVSVGMGDQWIDNHTRIDHAKPNCNSFEVYKAILGDHATGVFNGKIFVYEDAQKTDAKQTNQTILLSPTATVDTKPQLEIFADDVKCTHGATVGQLREEALFYLRSRGIPKKEAEGLLIYAFAAEILAKVTIPSVRQKLEKALFAKLKESNDIPLEG